MLLLLLNLVFLLTSVGATTTTFRNCQRAPAKPADRRNITTRLNVATFNAEFLMLKAAGQLNCPGAECRWKDAEMAAAHFAAVAQIVRAMDVDILQLTEVGDCDALQALVDQLALLGDDSYRPYVLQGMDSYTGQNVALLTRVDPIADLQRTEARVEYPVEGSTCYSSRPPSPAVVLSNNATADQPTPKKAKGVSKHFFTRFAVAGLARPITIVGLHFLARPDDSRRCTAREAQASVIAQVVKQAVEELGDDVIVLGDYNDFDDKVPDIKNSRPISQVHRIIREAAGTDRPPLESVARKAAFDKRFSNWWDKDRDCVYNWPAEVSSLDHIVLSKGLFDRVSRVQFGHELFTQSCSTLVSDHFPILATIQTDETPGIPVVDPVGSCVVYGCEKSMLFTTQSCQCHPGCKALGNCCFDYIGKCVLSPPVTDAPTDVPSSSSSSSSSSDSSRSSSSSDSSSDPSSSDSSSSSSDSSSDPTSSDSSSSSSATTEMLTSSSDVVFKECMTVPETPMDRRVNKKQLRIATFNAEFLFLHGFGRLQCPGEDCVWESHTQALAHVTAIAQLVKSMDVDIMQLTEVEDCTVLEALVTAMADDSYKPYLIRGSDRFTGQNVAIITRIDPIADLQRSKERVTYPLAETACGAFNGTSRTKTVSKHFFTRFAVDGMERNLTMAGVHFLARPDDPVRCFQREAQATVIRHVLDHAVNTFGDQVIVLGDYNDYDSLVPDIKASQPISSVVDIIRQSGNGLESVATYVDQASRYTNWWNKEDDCIFKVPQEVSSLDHIFLSKTLHAKVSHVQFGHDMFKQGCGQLTSDHFPLVATITL